ncbi:hypothetical protein [Actinomadura nitritigenes]|uniref:hypothetical protein n=1 Tax=Actinomadura nitritigenes TaxID=134602 RepID=UPI003D8CBB3F
MEFPDWRIEQREAPREESLAWTATRFVPPAGGGCTQMQADDPGVLGELLHENDRLECARALEELAAEMRRRWSDVAILDGALVIKGPGRRGTATARRGVFRAATGAEIGPIGDVTGAAERILHALRLA